MSLLITNGTVVTSLDPIAVEQADVFIGGGHVVGLGDPSEQEAAERVIKTCIDASGCLVMPGNVNAHMHLYSALARGMPYDLEPPTDFLQILQRVWWRLDRALDDESVRASVLLGGMEALLAGTTALVDHHASPNAVEGALDIVAEALSSLGLRSVCCYEVSDRDGAEIARAGLDESRRFAARCATGELPLARAMVGAHASFTLSDETLAGCVEIADEAGIGIHIHAAEDGADEVDAERRYGLRVAARLAEAGVLNERTLLAHGVHLDEDETRLVRASGATLAHNARSNMNNNVGRTPLAGLGDRVALGTDGIGSDMFTESQTAFFRLAEDGGAGYDWPLARLHVGAGVAGRAFGEAALGSIKPGAPADITILDYDAPTPMDSGTLAGHWLFGLGSRHVRDVVVAGQPVVRDRRLTLVDQDEIVAQARSEATRMWGILDTYDAHPYDPGEV